MFLSQQSSENGCIDKVSTIVKKKKVETGISYLKNLWFCMLRVCNEHKD